MFDNSTVFAHTVMPSSLPNVFKFVLIHRSQFDRTIRTTSMLNNINTTEAEETPYYTLYIYVFTKFNNPSLTLKLRKHKKATPIEAKCFL